MADDRTGAVARVEGHAVRAAEAAVPHDHEPPKHRAEGHAAKPHAAAAPVASATRPTELSFEPDLAAERIVVQVVDRETGSVVRSFPLVLPGGDGEQQDEAPRGALVDAKA